MYIETSQRLYGSARRADLETGHGVDEVRPGNPVRQRIDDRLGLVTFSGTAEEDDLGGGFWPVGEAALLCVSEGAVSLRDCAGQSHLLTAGTACLGLNHGVEAVRFGQVEGPVAFALLTVPPTFVSELLRERCPGCLVPALARAATGPVSAPIQLLPDLHAVLHQLLCNDLRPELRPMFRAAKAYELLSLTLEQLCCRSHKTTLSPMDIRRLRQARAILDESVAEPPSLLELARVVGINDFKLKKGFKELFGTTPYSYLTSRRMSLARETLLAGETSVTEVANAVGYTNLGHFAAAFRKKYGAAPRDFRRQARLAAPANSATGSN